MFIHVLQPNKGLITDCTQSSRTKVVCKTLPIIFIVTTDYQNLNYQYSFCQNHYLSKSKKLINLMTIDI